jgi:hypothetical protein
VSPRDDRLLVEVGAEGFRGMNSAPAAATGRTFGEVLPAAALGCAAPVVARLAQPLVQRGNLAGGHAFWWWFAEHADVIGVTDLVVELEACLVAMSAAMGALVG